mgnify:FL=1
MSEAEILAVFELLKHHYPYVLDFICANVPSAKTLLAGPSAAEKKLRKLQALDGQED